MNTLPDQEFFKLSPKQMQAYIEQHENKALAPIDSAEISVIIQGPVFTQTHALAPNGVTAQVLTALRQQLPRATLILSTWKNQPVEGLDADIILELDDPGTTNFYIEGAQADNFYNNGNRLIYSTQHGLTEVKTRYTLKIRSDLLLFHSYFSHFLHQFDQVDPDWQIFKQRLLSFPLYSLKFEEGIKAGHLIRQVRPFHVSDWAYFGQTQDLKKLFACPLMPEPQTSRWFEQRPKPDNDLWQDRLWRYSPEQYITSHLAQAEFGIELEHASQDDAAIVEASERIVANNFIILDQYQWGLYSLKLQNCQDTVGDNIKDGLYSHQIWRQDYQNYCVSTEEANVV